MPFIGFSGKKLKFSRTASEPETANVAISELPHVATKRTAVAAGDEARMQRIDREEMERLRALGYLEQGSVAGLLRASNISGARR